MMLRAAFQRRLASTTTKKLLYEADQSYKFKYISALGGVYTACWMSYVGVDALMVNPDGAIASNAPLVGLIGVSSLSVGAYLLKTFSSKTVGRLELISSDDKMDRLRITTYTPFGAEQHRDAPPTDVIPLTPPNDPSRLRTFALPDDVGRSFLVFVDPGDVKDETTFHRIIHGISPPRHHKRRHRRRRTEAQQ